MDEVTGGSMVDHDAAGGGAAIAPVSAAVQFERDFMYSPLSRILRRRPVTCLPGVSVREVLERINEAKVGSMVVTDERGEKPLGVFTLRDLLQRVSLADYDLSRPVAEVMTKALVTLPSHVSAYQAAVVMARHGLRHLLVVDNGRLVGVVSQNDVLSLQRLGAREVGLAIHEARDLGALKQCAEDVRQLAVRMLRQGLNVETLTQLVSTLNDLVTLRVIELTIARFHHLPYIPICWIALGSEGRFEQTLSTDQDNGLIFLPDHESETEAARLALLPFAEEVNKALDYCGFPLCKGNIMAGNPDWCLSFEEWQRKFSYWILKPEPHALLNAMIFFDFRPLYGDERLAQNLRSWLLESIQGKIMFMSHMAADALSCRPPLGMFRDFVVESGKRGVRGTIDLKLYGSRPFVDAARLLALASGVTHTNTAERLRGVWAQKGLVGEQVEAIVEAFYFIYLTRLRAQVDPATPAGSANRINPYLLNDMNRQMLKESFKQAKKLQAMIESDPRFSLSPERMRS